MPIERPPPGFRFLMQLVDARNEEEAKLELTAAYGKRVTDVAHFVRGSLHPRNERMSNPWIAKKTGFTVYIPNGFIL